MKMWLALGAMYAFTALMGYITYTEWKKNKKNETASKD